MMPNIEELIKKSKTTKKFRKGLRPDMVALSDVDPFQNQEDILPRNPEKEDSYFQNIEIEKISPDPGQPREYFEPEALTDLKQSIKEKGVLQPIIVRKENGNVILVAGERRLRAAKMAGLTIIPTVNTNGNPAEIALIENIQRENLTPIEEAKAYKKIIEEHGYTHEKLSKAIGKGRSTISEILSINKLPEEIKDECKSSNEYSKAVLVEIAKQKTKIKMISTFNEIKENKLGVRQTRKISRPPNIKNIRSPIDIAADKITDLTKYLKKLDVDSMEQNDKDKLQPGLKTLLSVLNNDMHIVKDS